MMQRVITLCRNGRWFQIQKTDVEMLSEYYIVRDELTVTDDNILLRGKNVVIPASLINQVVALAHEGHQLSDINLSPEVIRKCMCPLPNKFSRSPDGIPSVVLRSLSFELCTPLYYLFRQSLDTGTCPSLWKSADITPVYKKGDASHASN